MIRIVAELVFFILIAIAVFSLARRAVGRRAADRRGVARTATAATTHVPPQASWRALHVGNDKNQTEVIVELQVGGGTTVWDRPVCAVIDNQDPDYDKRLYNAVEDARGRATLLNGLRDV